MLRIYLDANIYITGFTKIESDCATILNEIPKRDVFIVQSDHLMNEVLEWFKRNKGKDWTGLVRFYMVSLPKRELVHSSEWSLLLPKWDDLIDDKKDVPHICSYFAGECDCFVTTNRRLTRMKIHPFVSFQSPEECVKRLMQSGNGNTKNNDSP
jgi:predicted nucleic acid-binding protein